MQPRSHDAEPRRAAQRGVEGGATDFARDAASRAELSRDQAGEMQRRVAEQRVRYQEVLIRHEIRQAERENEEAAALDREEARLDAASEAEFMREQIAPMLQDGWTLKQLEEIGISRRLLESLGLLHDVVRREE